MKTNENKSNTLEFRINNPMCSFCDHSYMNFFHTWCSIKNDCRNLSAKNCEHYKASLKTR